MYRIRELLHQEKKLFHTQDLALLWQIKNSNLLYTTIKRYVKKGVLYRIHKGFYCAGEITKQDPLVFGAAFYHDYCYVSTETILAEQGIINRQPKAVTFVGGRPLKFEFNGQNYLFRQMKSERLFQNQGIKLINGVLVADISRAKADMKYFNPNFYFDREVK